MKLNREWRLVHQMSKNPTIYQEIDWYIKHSKIAYADQFLKI